MSKYDASSIEWLQGIEAIRHNVGNYAGAIDSAAILHLVKEVVANSVDESSNGYGDTIWVDIDNKGFITIADRGRGIPVGPHPKHPKIDTLTLIFTELHTGGKSSKNSSGYESGTGGVHGLGLAVVNALSDSLEVWSYRNGWHHQSFAKGKAVNKVIKSNNIPKLFDHNEKQGTIIRFKPDTSILKKGSKLDTAELISWLKDLSWFASCNTIKNGKLVSRNPIKFILSVNGKKATIHRKSFSNYFDKLLVANKLEPVAFDEPFVLQTKNLDIVVGWCNDDGNYFLGLTNVIKNINGGTHVKAVQKIIENVFKEYRKRGDIYRPDDLFAGMVGAINIRIKHPRFSSQDKVKLVSEEAEEIIKQDFEPIFSVWAKKNKKSIYEIIERANAISHTNNELKNNRKLAAKLNIKKGGKTLLPPKMLVSSAKNPEDRELFLVEGDSALGSCAVASDRTYQEVLPLRGKLPNVLRETKASKQGADINDTIVNILKAAGITPAEGTKSMRVGKIMLLMDADADGPLSGETKVRLFNQTNLVTIKEIYNNFDSYKENGLYVWSGIKDKFTPSLITHVSKIVTDKHLIVKLNNGAIIRMTENHRQYIVCGEYNIKYQVVYANQLKVGDIIPVLTLSDNFSYEQLKHNYTISSITVANVDEDFYCLTVPESGNFYIYNDDNAQDYMLTGNSHIASLVLGLFLKYAPNLFSEGKVYFVDTPLYTYQSKTGEKVYADTYEDLLNKVGDVKIKAVGSTITRAKGLGELNADILEHVAFSKSTRKLVQIGPEEVRTRVRKIMGDDATYRKKILGV